MGKHAKSEKGRHIFTDASTPQADDLASPGIRTTGRGWAWTTVSGAARRPLPRVCPQEDFMITKLIGAATAVAATPVGSFGSEAALSQAGDCGSKDAKPDAKDKAKTKDAKDAKGKAKEGGCGGGGGCGSADMKKDKKDKKEGSCGKDKKEEKK